AACLDLPAQVAGLAGDAEQLLESFVVRLQLLIGDAPILNRHIGRQRGRAVALDQARAQLWVVFGPAETLAVPVIAGSADARARQERFDSADRQCRLVARVA